LDGFWILEEPWGLGLDFFLKMKRPFGSKFKVGLISDTYLKNSRAEFKASSGPIQQLQPIAFTTPICLLRLKAWLKLLWMKKHVYSSARLLQSNHKEPGLRQLLMRKPIESPFIMPLPLPPSPPTLPLELKL
jgi:hypothetical protein